MDFDVLLLEHVKLTSVGELAKKGRVPVKQGVHDASDVPDLRFKEICIIFFL